MEEKMEKINRKIVSILALTLLCLSSGYSLTITHGPYLTNMSEDAVTVVWFTDKPACSQVEYGPSYSLVEEGAEKGLMNVTTHHKIRLTGLTPGTEYSYRVSSSEATNYVAYWASMGPAIKSADYSFRTFDRDDPSVSFTFVSDTKNNGTKLKSFFSAMDMSALDFVVLGGNCLSYLENSSTIISELVDPVTESFATERPFVFLRGKEEMAGEIAQSLIDYFPVGEHRYYQVFTKGDATFFAIDAGMDKPDSDLIRSEDYKKKELQWFKNYINAKKDIVDSSAFKIALSSQKDFGYGNSDDWSNFLIENDVKFLLSGNEDAYYHREPSGGLTYHTVVVGYDNYCKVDITESSIKVAVYKNDGTSVDTFSIEK